MLIRVVSKPFNFSPHKPKSEVARIDMAYWIALQANYPMSYLNYEETHWIPFNWSNLPISDFERILAEDGERLG